MGALKERCVIIGGGDCSAEILVSYVTDKDFVICADGGYDSAVSAGIAPDLLVGDFDSINAVPDCCKIVTLPVEKDITDGMAAFAEGKERGYKSFVLFGGTGGRFEHTYANILIMADAVKNGYEFIMVDDRHIYRCLYNSSIVIPYKENIQISVFPIGGTAYGVSEMGFHYSLDNVTLEPFNHIGISNDVREEEGTITVRNGMLLIIETKMI